MKTIYKMLFTTVLTSVALATAVPNGSSSPITGVCKQLGVPCDSFDPSKMVNTYTPVYASQADPLCQCLKQRYSVEQRGKLQFETSCLSNGKKPALSRTKKELTVFEEQIQVDLNRLVTTKTRIGASNSPLIQIIQAWEGTTMRHGTKVTTYTQVLYVNTNSVGTGKPAVFLLSSTENVSSALLKEAQDAAGRYKATLVKWNHQGECSFK